MTESNKGNKSSLQTTLPEAAERKGVDRRRLLTGSAALATAILTAERGPDRTFIMPTMPSETEVGPTPARKTKVFGT
jgi:hypothetical protein